MMVTGMMVMVTLMMMMVVTEMMVIMDEIMNGAWSFWGHGEHELVEG